MSKLLLLALLFSRETIITRLASAALIRPASTPYRAVPHPEINTVTLQIMNTALWIADHSGTGLKFIADTTLLNESVSPTHIKVDRPAIGVLPIGNYRYMYKVKPLVNLARR